MFNKDKFIGFVLAIVFVFCNTATIGFSANEELPIAENSIIEVENGESQASTDASGKEDAPKSSDGKDEEIVDEDIETEEKIDEDAVGEETADEETEDETTEDTEIVLQSFVVIFTDEDEVLDEIEITQGEYILSAPKTDAQGNEIVAWVADGVKINDVTKAQITKDTVYNVWKAPQIKKDSHKQYMNGYEGKFRPNDKLTRGEFCSIFNQVYELYDNDCDKEFSDVKQDAWYSEHVSNMVATGIINGYPDGTFKPDKALTRAEFVAVICNAFKLEEQESKFLDTQSHWAENQIVYASQNGWVNGYSDGTFHPDDSISRAEATVIVNRLMERSAANSVQTLKENNVCPFYDVRPSEWYYADVMEATVEHTPSNTADGEEWQTFEFRKSGYEEGLAKIGGIGCYVDANGQFRHVEPSTIIELDGKKYLTRADGLIDLSHSGITNISGAMYYFNQDGSMLTNGKFGYLYFGENGKYTCGNSELDALVDAALAKCTNSGMQKWEKLRASYLYLRDNCKYLSRSHHPRGSTAFVEESATFMFKNMRGNCYCYASCFLLMARRLGYEDAYIVSGGVGTNNSDHAWVMIGSKIFDPELEYAYRYRYATKRYYNLYDMAPNAAPFKYHFPG